MKAEKDVKSFRNTDAPKGLPNKEERSMKSSKRERLKMEIEENKGKYDFKVIKRKFLRPQ